MASLRSLRSLTIAFLLAFGLVTGGTGYAIFQMTRNATIALVDQRIEAVSELALRGTGGEAAAILRNMEGLAGQRDTGDIGMLLTDAGGRRIAGNIALGRALPLGASTITAEDGIPGLSEGRALVVAAGPGLRLATIAETEPIDEYASERIRIYALGFGSIILVVLGGTLLFSTMVSRRIAALRGTAEAIFDGDLQRRLPVDPSGGAFAGQAIAFNRMLDRIVALMEGLRNISNDVAHDLRSPLGRLRGRLALLKERPAAAPVRGELEDALAECDTLLAMFAATLRIAEVEQGKRRAGFAPVDLTQLVHDIAETMQPVAAERGHALAVQAAETPVAISGDRQLLSQALINLIENALLHTPAGTPIKLSLAVAGGHALLTVRDHGPGIPVEERALALRRFGRLERSRNSPGHGLGLPLADAVTRLHQGMLTLREAEPGLAVVLALPLVQG